MLISYQLMDNGQAGVHGLLPFSVERDRFIVGGAAMIRFHVWVASGAREATLTTGYS